MVLESFLRDLVRKLKFAVTRIRQSPLAIVGVSIVILYIIIALLAPLLAPPGHPTQGGDPYRIWQDGFSQIPKPPSPRHPFGTTQSQYDIYYGCIWGTRTAFIIGFSVVFSALAIGLLIGALAGYFGGVIDELVMRFTDIFLLLPGFLFAMALVILLIPMGFRRVDTIILALSLVGGASYVRIVRGEIFRLKHESYAKAAEAVGFSNLGAVVKPIVPDLMYPILTIPFLGIGPIILTAATLSFLGLGPPIGYADWGQMIAMSRNWIYGRLGDPFMYWYTYVIPGLFLFTFVLGWILLSDAFRDVLTRLRESNWKEEIIQERKSM